MAVVSYTLDDMASANAQDAAVQLCWERLSNDGVLVVIEKQLRAGSVLFHACVTRPLPTTGDRQQKDHAGTMRQKNKA